MDPKKGYNPKKWYANWDYIVWKTKDNKNERKRKYSTNSSK